MAKENPVKEQPQAIIFSHKKVVEALIKQHEIKDGIWGLYVEFTLGAANVKGPQSKLSPAAMVAVTKLGLHPTDNVNDLSVDASTITPAKKTKASSAKKTKK